VVSKEFDGSRLVIKSTKPKNYSCFKIGNDCRSLHRQCYEFECKLHASKASGWPRIKFLPQVLTITTTYLAFNPFMISHLSARLHAKFQNPVLNKIANFRENRTINSVTQLKPQIYTSPSLIFGAQCHNLALWNTTILEANSHVLMSMLYRYKNLVLVAGGAGVTPFLAII